MKKTKRNSRKAKDKAFKPISAKARTRPGSSEFPEIAAKPGLTAADRKFFEAKAAEMDAVIAVGAVTQSPAPKPLTFLQKVWIFLVGE